MCVNNFEEWCIQARDEKLISDIEECVSSMVDLSLASATLEYVSKRIPGGNLAGAL